MTSERPYPEAPLASRRADPKPEKRVKDKSVYAEFHRIHCFCLHCGCSPVAASHLLRGKNREDVLEALIPLAPWCHEAFDEGNRVNGPYGEVKAANVRAAVARFLRSPAGEKNAAYLIRKLGPNGALDYLQRLEAA